MKKILISIILVFFAFSFLQAQENGDVNENENEEKLQISGYFSSDQRLLINKNTNWIWNENRLSLQLDKKLFENSTFHSEIWLRNFGLPNYYKLSDLYNKGIVNPFDIGIIETYIKIPKFIFNNLDLTVGRQNINWGMADKINPTNSLNPDDFEDILDFGRKKGIDAIRLNYYFNNSFSLEAVFVPFFQATNLPGGPFADLMMQKAGTSTSKYQIIELRDTLELPAKSFKEQMSAGFRFKGFVAGIDFALSYNYGRDFLPQPYYSIIRPINYPPTEYTPVNILYKLKYPRQHVLGLNLSANLFGAGIWAEAAMYKYNKSLILSNDISAYMPPNVSTPITIDSTIISKPFFKFIVGTDYHFAYDIYANIQYMHGFLHERGKSELNDYLFLRLEKSFFYGKLKIAPIAGSFIISDFSDIKNNFSIIYMPEIKYIPVENFEISLSTAIFEGKGSSLFSGLKDMDMFIMKLKYYF